MSILRFFCVTCLLAQFGLITGCTSQPGPDDQEEVEHSEQALYQSAQRSLRAANYPDAIAKLQALEARYPFGRYAEQAQLELIYAHYMGFQPEAARDAADRFIQLHPQHANADYAYYLKALAAYEKDENFFGRFLGSDRSARDIGAARESFGDFAQLITRFPRSEYAPDARQRMIYLRNLLATAEINIGRYYLSRQAYASAANRGRYVVENFPSSLVVPDGLVLMIESYLKLNLPEPANDALRILVRNYPNHPALDAEGALTISPAVRNSDRSWMNIVTLGLLDKPDVPDRVEISIPDNEEPALPLEAGGPAPERDEPPDANALPPS